MTPDPPPPRATVAAAAAKGFGLVNLGFPPPPPFAFPPILRFCSFGKVGVIVLGEVFSAVGSRVGTGLRKEVLDLDEPVGEVRGDVGICERGFGGVEGRKGGRTGVEFAVVDAEDEEVRAGGVEGAVLKEEAESFEKCCKEEGRGGFFGLLYCLGEGIVVKECNDVIETRVKVEFA